MKEIIKFLIVVLFLTGVATAIETTWRHSGFEIAGFDINGSSTYNITEIRKIEFGWNTSIPAVSEPNRAVMYYDNNEKRIMYSIDGGAYSAVDGTYTIINVTQNYTIANASMTLFNVSAATGTLNMILPSPIGSGKIFTITKTDASSNAVQINVTGNGLIDGALWANITSQWTSLDLVDIQSMWKII